MKGSWAGSRASRLLWATVSVAAVAALVSLQGAGAAARSAAPAADLATAVTDPAIAAGSTFKTVPASGNPTAVSTSQLAGFPTAGSSYAVLSTGDATAAGNANSNATDDPSRSDDQSASDGNATYRGQKDVTTLELDVNAPSGANCVAFDYRFLTDEYPEAQSSSTNDDAFVAELDTNDWSTSGSTLTAPHSVVQVRASSSSVTAGGASGTTYDGGTGVTTATATITPGQHALFFSVIDFGDDKVDSTVLLDNLHAGVKDSGGNCIAGAASLSASATADAGSITVGGVDGYTITIANAGTADASLTNITDILPSGFTYSFGSTTGITTSEPSQAAQTLTWSGPFIVPAGGSVSLHFNVTVPTTAGDYYDQAGATPSDPSLSPPSTGQTARITVAGSSSSEADLNLQQSPSTTSPSVGGPLTIHVALSNRGPGSATGIVLTDFLPSGTSFTSAGSGACAYDSISSVLTCNFGSLASGATVGVDLVLNVTMSGALDNYASVIADQYDPNAQDNFAELVLAVADSSGYAGPTPSGGDQGQSGGSPSGDGGSTPNGPGISLPQPQAGQSVNVVPTKGLVLVQLPGAHSFLELGEARQLPVGTTVDTTNGTVRLTSSGGAGTFSGGVFKLAEPAAAQGRATSATAPTARTTQLQLVGGDFTHCTASNAKSKSGKRFVVPGSTIVRQLWGRGVGSFRTVGRYATATTKNAYWLTADRCDGTLTRVKSGNIQLVDSARKRKLVLKTGASYLAAPKKATPVKP